MYDIDISKLASSATDIVISKGGPSLTEPGVRYFIGGSLKQIRHQRFNASSLLFNLVLFMLFCGFIGVLGYVIYWDKITNKTQRDQYILSQKVQQTATQIQQEQRRINKEMITDLPPYQNEFENVVMRLL